LVNEGNFDFKTVALPMEAQFTPIYAIETHDFDQDGDLDIVMGGNLYGTKPEVGRYDASYGVYLENLGGHNFKYHTDGDGFYVDGELRDLKIANHHLLAARNNDAMLIFNF
jgi:hypothetical protein